MSAVDHVVPVPESGCWLWGKSWNSAGYGQAYRGTKAVGAHRVVWEELIGPIPAGLDLCHKCDTPPCCNPDHLFLGTRSDNLVDMVRKGRGNARRGESAGRAVLSDAEVEEIRRDAGGSTRAALARRYGVSPATISQIVLLRSRKGGR